MQLNIANSNKDQTAHLHLEVEDSGIGISRENRKKIFESFEQIIKHMDATLGTGLGLAITRQYVKLMAGKITVESTFGKGSVFRMDLPVETVTDQGFKRVESSFGQVVALKEGQLSYRILIVEDNLNSRKLLREILKTIARHLNVRYCYAKSSQAENHPPKDCLLYHLTDHELKLLPAPGQKRSGKRSRLPRGMLR